MAFVSLGASEGEKAQKEPWQGSGMVGMCHIGCSMKSIRTRAQEAFRREPECRYHSVSAPVPVVPECYHGGKGAVSFQLGMISFSGFRVHWIHWGLWLKQLQGPPAAVLIQYVWHLIRTRSSQAVLIHKPHSEKLCSHRHSCYSQPLPCGPCSDLSPRCPASSAPFHSTSSGEPVPPETCTDSPRQAAFRDCQPLRAISPVLAIWFVFSFRDFVYLFS